jgi:uncharacterized C2H2 Zn-finger protein
MRARSHTSAHPRPNGRAIVPTDNLSQQEKGLAMPRTRKAPSSKSATKTVSTASANPLTCPECGKTFSRAASLGAHRNRAHGIAGASNRRTPRRTRVSNGGRRTETQTATRTQPSHTRRRATSTANGTLNRDALLQTLFPNGLPPREDVIRRANAWLDEAEKLARTK